jgi:hypothetical protein
MSSDSHVLGMRERLHSHRSSDRHWLTVLLLCAALLGHTGAQTATMSGGGGTAGGVSSAGGSGGVIPVRRAVTDRERGPVPITPP